MATLNSPQTTTNKNNNNDNNNKNPDKDLINESTHPARPCGTSPMNEIIAEPELTIQAPES